MGGIEEEIREETGQELSEAGQSLTVRQRRAIPFREIARVAFKLYPRRAVLGFSLFVGQAFMYNGITFNLGTLLTRSSGWPRRRCRSSSSSTRSATSSVP